MQNGGRWMLKVALAGFSLLALALVLPLTNGVLVNNNNDGNAISDGIRLKGTVDMALHDESGNLKDERHFDNLMVNAGVEGVASRIAPHDGSVNPASPFNYIALGTGNTAVSAAQTALAAEFPTGENYARLQDPVAQYTTTSGNKLILSVTFLPGQATGTIRESGIFNAETGGDMLARQTFTEIQKAAGDTLTVTWTITLSPS